MKPSVHVHSHHVHHVCAATPTTCPACKGRMYKGVCEVCGFEAEEEDGDG